MFQVSKVFSFHYFDDSFSCLQEATAWFDYFVNHRAFDKRDIFLILNISDLFIEIVENQSKNVNKVPEHVKHLLGKHSKETVISVCNEFFIAEKSGAAVFPVVVDVLDSVAMTQFLYDLCDWPVNKFLFTPRVIKWYSFCPELIYTFSSKMYDCTIQFVNK